MASFTINVADGVTPALQEALPAFNKNAVKEVVGVSVTELLRRHLFEYGKNNPNKIGGKRTNYWGKAARSVTWKRKGGGIIVSISQVGVSLHYHGGIVKPVKKKYLAIPARALAHGKRPKEFNLKPLVRTRNGKAVPVALVATGGKYKGKPYFWLVKQAKHNPTPEIIPTEDQFMAASERGIGQLTDKALKKGKK